MVLVNVLDYKKYKSEFRYIVSYFACTFYYVTAEIRVIYSFCFCDSWFRASHAQRPLHSHHMGNGVLRHSQGNNLVIGKNIFHIKKIIFLDVLNVHTKVKKYWIYLNISKTFVEERIHSILSTLISYAVKYIKKL